MPRNRNRRIVCRCSTLRSAANATTSRSRQTGATCLAERCAHPLNPPRLLEQEAPEVGLGEGALGLVPAAEAPQGGGERAVGDAGVDRALVASIAAHHCGHEPNGVAHRRGVLAWPGRRYRSTPSHDRQSDGTIAPMSESACTTRSVARPSSSTASINALHRVLGRAHEDRFDVVIGHGVRHAEIHRCET